MTSFRLEISKRLFFSFRSIDRSRDSDTFFCVVLSQLAEANTGASMKLT